MEELILLTNPRRRGKRSRRNLPVGFDEFGNPIMTSMSQMTYQNPKIRRKNVARRKGLAALAAPGTWREWTQGVDLMDAGAAVGGLAAATMIPAMIVPVTNTNMQKFWKLLASIGSAVGAGALGRAMISQSAGKAAIIGGVAGAAAQAIGMWTTFQIGGAKRIGRRGLGEAALVSPPTSREGEIVSVIQP